MSEESLLSGNAPAPSGVQQDADAGKPAEGAGETPKVENQPNADAGKGEGEQGKQESQVPDKYEFALPEGYELDAEIGEEFGAYAKELGLTQDKAQKAIDIATKWQQKLQQSQADTFKAQRAAWRDEVKADPEIGGAGFAENLGYAAKVLDTFAPELRELLGTTGFGDNPVFVRAFVRIGKAISEDRLTGGEQRGAPAPSAADVMYPTMKR